MRMIREGGIPVDGLAAITKEAVWLRTMFEWMRGLWLCCISIWKEGVSVERPYQSHPNRFEAVAERVW